MEGMSIIREEKKDLSELKPTQAEMMKYMVEVRKYCLGIRYMRG